VGRGGIGKESGQTRPAVARFKDLRHFDGYTAAWREGAARDVLFIEPFDAGGAISFRFLHHGEQLQP